MTDKCLGKYKLQEKLGEGAFAEVYRAVDTTLDRSVALKILKPQLLVDSEAVARFTQEARTLANLVHPRIAWVWELGAADGEQYLAMRYVTGQSLDKVLKARQSLPWAEALAIVQHTAEGLDFAHQKGLVHRDVKPGNIMVSPEEGAVLTDFGLVKALESSGLTRTRVSVGTPQYMAPETWDGLADAAADQYALACVLAEMLTGIPPFDGLTDSAVMKQHVLGEPAFPEQWPAGTPDGVEGVLNKALAKDSQQRYEHCGEFVVELKRLGSEGFEKGQVFFSATKLSTHRSQPLPEKLLLEEASNLLDQGRITDALKIYNDQIRTKNHLELIISDLLSALERHPVNPEIWATLGYAYQYIGRERDALDAYTKAEELLR
jgi:eukaryotic-like serine/threonine-protein kinase